MISVVDYVLDDHGEKLVIWAIQPRIDVSTDVLCGAWILGEGETNPLSSLEQIITNTTVVVLNPAVEPLLPAGITRTSVTAIEAAMQDYRQQYVTKATEFKEQAAALKKSFTMPKFAKIQAVDPQEFQAGYHGEPIAQNAWLVAQVLVDLVHQWKATDATRRSRDVLKEAYGAHPLPLPTPAISAE